MKIRAGLALLILVAMPVFGQDCPKGYERLPPSNGSYCVPIPTPGTCAPGYKRMPSAYGGGTYCGAENPPPSASSPAPAPVSEAFSFKGLTPGSTTKQEFQQIIKAQPYVSWDQKVSCWQTGTGIDTCKSSWSTRHMNLEPEETYTAFFYEGVMDEFAYFPNHNQYRSLVEAFKDKYGAPALVEQHTFQNGAGATFTGTDYTWIRGERANPTQMLMLSEYRGRTNISAVEMIDNQLSKAASPAANESQRKSNRSLIER